MSCRRRGILQVAHRDFLAADAGDLEALKNDAGDVPADFDSSVAIAVDVTDRAPR